MRVAATSATTSQDAATSVEKLAKSTWLRKGCKVIHRPTGDRCAVVRVDPDELILLAPVPPSPCKGSTVVGEQRQTRWSFQQDVEAVGVAGSKVATNRACHGSGLVSSSLSATDEGLPACSTPSISDYPTPYARRAARLDERLVFRKDGSNPRRGRGLFAVRDVPAGMDVMRDRAVSALVVRRCVRRVCYVCFASQPQFVPEETCPWCSSRCCAKCARQGSHSAVCRFYVGVEALKAAGCEPEEDLLRLAVDILARRRAGIIDDEKWELLCSLESEENEAGTIGLSEDTMRQSIRLCKDALELDVSEEELQAMYRRYSEDARVREGHRDHYRLYYGDD